MNSQKPIGSRTIGGEAASRYNGREAWHLRRTRIMFDESAEDLASYTRTELANRFTPDSSALHRSNP
jgi:hypothetical protein